MVEESIIYPSLTYAYVNMIDKRKHDRSVWRMHGSFLRGIQQCQTRYLHCNTVFYFWDLAQCNIIKNMYIFKRNFVPENLEKIN